MSALHAKKLAQQVAEMRSSPDNKRCFNCESLGTTYYVPPFSIFVCTQCSGIHMQFGHRVKSVTLAEYKADEVEQMRQGGNQVAAYRYLARYTPDKDLRKPVDRNPQRIRTWIQTVFVDKRYFSADAPVPRRSVDSTAPSPAASSAGGSTAAALIPSSSFQRSSSRENSVPASPLPSPAVSVAASGRLSHVHEPGSPPVHDVRELLGDKATALQIGPKRTTDDSRAASGAGTPPAPAAAQAAAAQAAAAQAAAAAAKPAPASPQQPAFDPFAAPEAPVSTPVMQAICAAPGPAAPPATAANTATTGFDPFSRSAVAVTPAAAAAAGAPSTPVAAAPTTPVAAAPATSAAAGSQWTDFDEAPAFGAVSQIDTTAAAPKGAAEASSTTNSNWASFGDEAAFTPAPASTAAASAMVAAAAPKSAAGTLTPRASTAGGASSTAAASPATSTGGSSSKGGKAPAKELSADLFADFAYAPQPAAVLPQQPGVMQFQQPIQQQLQASAGVGQPGYSMPSTQALQQPYQAWALQQQQAMMWQQQQLLQQQQQSAAYGGIYVGMRPQQGFGMPGVQQPTTAGQQFAMPGMNGVVPAAAAGMFNPMMQMGVQQTAQQQQQLNPSSGPPSTGATASWIATTAAVGVTEENAFADLVDLKKALPATAAGSTSSAPSSIGGFAAAQPMAMMMQPQLQQQQQQPYSMPVPAGVPSYSSPVVGMPGAYTGGMPASFLQQSPMQPQQPQPVLQQQSSFGTNWGMMQLPPGGAAATTAAPRSSDSGNPFA